MGEEAFNNAMQAITNRSFVLEANSVQPLNGRVYYVNSNTNFVSLNDGQAMVQIASNSPYPGPNGLGGITVQGSASNVQVKQENNGNVYLSMSVQGIFISATVNLVLYSGTNNAMVTVDPNFSGNVYLSMSDGSAGLRAGASAVRAGRDRRLRLLLAGGDHAKRSAGARKMAPGGAAVGADGRLHACVRGLFHQRSVHAGRGIENEAPYSVHPRHGGHLRPLRHVAGRL